jgi:hypothetical protein
MWTDREIDILKTNYPTGGYSSCALLLSLKSRGAINSKAFRLGLTVLPETKAHIAKVHGGKNLVHASGEENHNWKGGESARDYAEYKRKTKQKYPDRDKARALVRWAIKNGTIVKMPCQICGYARSEAHHEDYSKPLDVIFLCRKHHAEADKNRKIQ